MFSENIIRQLRVLCLFDIVFLRICYAKMDLQRKFYQSFISPITTQNSIAEKWAITLSALTVLCNKKIVACYVLLELEDKFRLNEIHLECPVGIGKDMCKCPSDIKYFLTSRLSGSSAGDCRHRFIAELEMDSRWTRSGLKHIVIAQYACLISSFLCIISSCQSKNPWVQYPILLLCSKIFEDYFRLPSVLETK